MYIPESFKEDDTLTLHTLIQDNPLGILVVSGSEGLIANHLPFVLDEASGPQGTLRAHVARANTVWEEISAGRNDALVIFHGASAYLTPSVYATKAETHRVVPTYNYTAVHACVRAVVVDDEKWLRANVGQLTRHFEAEQSQPWRMSDAPADFMTDLLGKIVGLEITITRLEGKWKLSQNRSRADQQGVIAHLQQAPSEQAHAVASEMARRLKRGSGP